MLKIGLHILLITLALSCNKESIKFNNANLVSQCGNSFTLQDRTINGEPGDSVLINIDDLTRPLVIQFRDRLTFNLVATRNVPAGEARVRLPWTAGSYEMIVKNDCGDTGYSYATTTLSTSTFRVDPSKRISEIGYTILPLSSNTLVSTADLDTDGDLDLIYLLPDTDPLGGYVPLFKVYLNNGEGDFTYNSGMSTFSTGASTWFSLTDVTGDDRADLVYSIQDPISGVCVRPWNAFSSRFGSEICSLHISVSADDPDYINKFQLHDFNNDGKVDIAMAVNEKLGYDIYDGSLVLMQGMGDGTFTQVEGITDLGPINNFILADINNDGKLDITVGSIDSSTALLYSFYIADSTTGVINKQEATASLRSQSITDEGNNLARSLRAINVTDINDDRILDIIGVSFSVIEQLLSTGQTYETSNSSALMKYNGNLILSDLDHVSQGEELIMGLFSTSPIDDLGGSIFFKEVDYARDNVLDSRNVLLNDVSSLDERLISSHLFDYNGDGHLDLLQVDAKYLQMMHFLEGAE